VVGVARLGGNHLLCVVGGMTINELRKRRKQLEIDIASEVSALVEKFKKETGHCPESISIDMMSVREMGDIEPVYVVNYATVDIRL
jgi:hypothetical protein